MTYEVLPLNDTILDPEPIASHEISHHDVGEQTVSNYGDLRWRSYAGVRMLHKVGKDLVFAPWLLS